MPRDSTPPKRPRTAWLVVFTEPGYATKPEIEVFTNRNLARQHAKAGLDPGWRSDLCRVYLDEWHESYSEPTLPVGDDE